MNSAGIQYSSLLVVKNLANDDNKRHVKYNDHIYSPPPQKMQNS